MRIVAALVAVAACGGGRGDGLTVATALQRSVDETCRHAHECRAEFPTDQGLTFEQLFQDTETDCLATFEANLDPAAEQASVDAGRVRFHPDDADECLDFFVGLDCAKYWQATFGEIPQPRACDTAFVGTVADGDACTIDHECIGASRCSDSTMTCGPT
jgi:hypothetical protein